MFIELDYDDPRFDDFGSTANDLFLSLYQQKNALSKTQIIKRSFILLSLFVGWCTECRNVHGVSIIKDAFLYSHLFYVFTLRNYLLYSIQQNLF